MVRDRNSAIVRAAIGPPPGRDSQRREGTPEVKVLGIHSGHNGSAALLEDGRLVALVCEERFSRRKNHWGFPSRSIRWIHEAYGLDGVDAVAMANLLAVAEPTGQSDAWADAVSGAGRFLPAAILTHGSLVRPYLAVRGLLDRRPRTVVEELREFGVDESKVQRVEHHYCHASATYWLDWQRGAAPTLVVTLDNTGDGLSGTIRLAAARGELRLLHTFPSLRSLGMMYTAVTRYLGMKRVEDEYKVMGLAPYARGDGGEKVYRILRRHLDLTPDELDLVNRTGLGESGFARLFAKELRGLRFDHVAAGAQMLIEELAVRLLRAWARKTGARRLAVGGGLFMNVKLNMLVNEMPEFERVFFLPSCGDEFNAAGAALACAYGLSGESADFDPEPLGPLYLGPEFSNEDALAALRRHGEGLRFRRSDDVERETAECLARGLIVGRLAGRMEFGARSLGNRSILSRADSLNCVRKINSAIKMRDFWMPFAPSILWERRKDYVENPRDSWSPYMILGFRSTRRAEEELVAGLHPFDLSCRPQLLEEPWNPRYHRMLRHFEGITGFGGCLNTSFNLHGDPMVCSPTDAIETYLASDLDVLTLEDFVAWDPHRLDLDRVLASSAR
jgi:carbamoyltransferase